MWLNRLEKTDCDSLCLKLHNLGSHILRIAIMLIASKLDAVSIAHLHLLIALEKSIWWWSRDWYLSYRHIHTLHYGSHAHHWLHLKEKNGVDHIQLRSSDF